MASSSMFFWISGQLPQINWHFFTSHSPSWVHCSFISEYYSADSAGSFTPKIRNLLLPYEVSIALTLIFDIYQRYTRRLVRIYATIAPYLFQEHELVFFAFFGSKKIPISQLHRIETRIIRNHRGPNSFRVYFYNEFFKIHQVTMNQRGAFDFLQEQLLEENPNLSIISKNH